MKAYKTVYNASIQDRVNARYAQRKFKGQSDRSLHCLWEFNAKDLRALPPEEKDPSVEVADRSASNAIIRELFHSFAEHESYMSEIQLRRIVVQHLLCMRSMNRCAALPEPAQHLQTGNSSKASIRADEG